MSETITNVGLIKVPLAELKAFDALQRLLAAARQAKTSGDAYLRLKLNCGGVQDVKIALEDH